MSELKMYSVEEIKSNPKITILVNNQKDIDSLISIDCVGHIPKFWGFPYFTTVHDKSWGNGSNFYKIYNYTIITVNQIKELNMEKEIIGYKLIKREYKDACTRIMTKDFISDLAMTLFKDSKTENNAINKLKKAGVLDLWFEPVYKQEFKVGDWVTIIQDVTTKGDTFKVTEDMLINIPKSFDLYYKKSWYSCPTQVRLAIKEEIEKAQEKIYTLGIDEKFEIVVKNKKAYYDSEDVTETLKDFQCQVPTLFHNTTRQIGKYSWIFDDIIISKVGCIKRKSLMSEWLAIDLN